MVTNFNVVPMRDKID